MIDLLLAACNSERFLREQVRSITGQSCLDWRLLIRDGGSHDNTLKLIQQLCQENPDRIFSISSDSSSGACGNFSSLLQSSTAPYVMFCDHDDVWMPNKIKNTFKAMQRAEREYGSEIPLLVYTDLMVVDENLCVLNHSCFDQQNIDPDKTELRQLLLQNVATGCTMMLNRALVDRIGTIPPEAVMHDHWAALAASCFGKMVYLDESTVLYRQHGNNFCGAAHYGWRYFYKWCSAGLSAVRKKLYLNVHQAEAFLKRYEADLSEERRCLLKAFIQLESSGWIGRRRILIRNRIFKQGFRRNAGIFLGI